MNPIVNTVKDNLKIVADLRQQFSRFQNDFQSDKSQVRSRFTLMASMVQMNNAIKESSDTQKSEMAELWKKIKKADHGYEKANSVMQDLKESLSNYKDDMYTFND
jgi:predicted  nucleic acid-binding Zn-ribbon protein